MSAGDRKGIRCVICYDIHDPLLNIGLSNVMCIGGRVMLLKYYRPYIKLL